MLDLPAMPNPASGRLPFPISLLCSAIAVSVAFAGQSGSAEPADGGAAPTETWTERFDRLWHQRDERGVLEQLYNMAKVVQKQNANDFEANVRLAAILVWQADGLADGTNAKAQSGKEGWSLADKALAVKSEDVRAQYYAGTGIGLYSEGVGILTALGEGLEGKFRSRAEAALRLDRNFLDGAPEVLWGRYFFKLPWPKRNVAESIKVLRACVAEHPHNLRAKLYLAESLLDDGEKQEAKLLIEQIDSAPIGIDPPEDRRIKTRAKQWAKQHQGDLD